MADPVETNPDLYSVVLENDRVRVLRYFDQPGDRTRPHAHPDSVMVTLSTFDRLLVHGDHQVKVHLEADEVRWLDAQEHSGENIGSSPTSTLFIELKEPRRTGPTVGTTLGPA